jgi:hypothetical protein
MNEDAKRRDIDELTGWLIRLRPARGQLDSRVVFYEAGYQAARCAASVGRRPDWSSAIAAAALLVLILAVPTSYRAGQRSAAGALAQQLATDRSKDSASSPELPQPVAPLPPASANPPLPIGSPPRSPAPLPTATAGGLASWIDPLLFHGEPFGLPPTALTTLAAFHRSALVAPTGNRNSSELYCYSTLLTYRDFSFGTAADADVATSSPLSVSHLSAVAQSLEASR